MDPLLVIPGDLNLSCALQFITWKVLPVFNLLIRRVLVYCQKITESKHTALSKLPRLIPRKEGKQKTKRSEERDQLKLLLKGRCCRNVAILLLSYKSTLKSQLVSL